MRGSLLAKGTLRSQAAFSQPSWAWRPGNNAFRALLSNPCGAYEKANYSSPPPPQTKFIEWATQELSADLERRLRQLEADVAFGAPTLGPEACSQDESKLLRREQQDHGALSALRGLLPDLLRA